MEIEHDNVALIDIDGTLADYDGRMRSELQKIMGPMERLPESLHGTGDDWFEARMDLIKRQTGFWRNLPLIPAGYEVYELLGSLGYQRMILTKGPRNTTHAWTEKVEWCAQHVPSAGITITRHGDDVDVHKGLVYGKVLFDDFPSYVEQWLRHRPRGKVLMLEHPHNKDFDHPNVFKVPNISTLWSRSPSEQVNWLEKITEFLGGDN